MNRAAALLPDRRGCSKLLAMTGSLLLHTPTALEYFASLVADDASLSVLEAAIALAHDDYPALDCQTVLAEIDALAARLKTRIAPDAAPMQRLRLLNRFFFQELGFAGNVNDYYDAKNSYLHSVLQTRRGIPITLAVLYVEIAGQIGLSASETGESPGRPSRRRNGTSSASSASRDIDWPVNGSITTSPCGIRSLTRKWPGNETPLGCRPICEAISR